MDAVAPLPKPPLAAPRRLLRLRSDAALAERFAAGEESAFAVLYERHRSSVLAVCMGVLGSTHDAEDAAQDAFAALAVTLREHPPRELRAWLARVARNAAIDVARRRRRTVNTDGDVPDVLAATSGAKAELESVLAGIRELPESQRTALLMRELAGHSYTEIAALLETDESAVRGLIARARMSLRTHREASELSCASARATLAAEPHGSTRDKTVRRHVRGCAPCRAYRQALRDDARARRGILPVPAGGGAILGGLAAKGALLGGAVTQLTAACAVSACAVGGVVLLDAGPHPHRSPHLPTARAGAASVLPAAAHRAPGSTGSARAPARGASATASARSAVAGTRPAGHWTPRSAGVHRRGSAPGTTRASGTAPAAGTATIFATSPASAPDRGRVSPTPAPAGATSPVHPAGSPGFRSRAGSAGFTAPAGTTNFTRSAGPAAAGTPPGTSSALAGGEWALTGIRTYVRDQRRQPLLPLPAGTGNGKRGAGDGGGPGTSTDRPG